ncbi:class I SAM-dependent methyltransferase [Prochlorococcus sp. MIT 1341]|uniref:class I SAM-dependent methyltransferase n=1 Tax=Prochlorococcus sp. MIT 1341 TaxID=3096221 RepID=UPI002A74F4D1|nr:class I SAM-dependent methyltransferase [Prochlorococcus sp. MIT 1341]
MAEPELTKLAYKTLQFSKSLAGLAHKSLSTKIMEILAPSAVPNLQPISRELLFELRKSINHLEDSDWQDAEDGIYPKAQLFEAPWLDWAGNYPLVWLDLPSTWERRKGNKIHDLPNEIDKAKFPDYYLQNFHHQTDGYLSNHSANLYDLQVEILFNGTADAMRRRILAPLKKGLKSFNSRKRSSIKLLDVATGTGRTLQQIARAEPGIELIGVDLSLAYLRKANRSLNTHNNRLVQLIRGNAEQLPFETASIQGVTCVYLLHELPLNIREKVLKECWRVLEPGGVFVIADSVQLDDSPKFKLVLDNFYKVFHEPFYRDYINDDIDSKLLKSGFENIEAESFFMTRVWSCNKPFNQES